MYALRLLPGRKILALDHRPELLNYLRLGLPDCDIKWVDSDQCEAEGTGISNLVQLRLQHLKQLNWQLEQLMTNSLLRPCFVQDSDTLVHEPWLDAFARAHDLDLTTTIKTQHLLARQRSETKAKCWLFWEKYAGEISRATSSAHLDQIKQHYEGFIHDAGRNV